MSSSSSGSGLTIFEGMTQQEVETLTASFRVLTAHERQVILRETEESHDLYCVLSGGVEVLRKGESGQRNLAIIKAGSCFGEVGCFTSEPRTASICAVAETRMLACNGEEIERLIVNHPKIAARFLCNILRITAARYAELSTHLANMVFWIGA